MLLAASGVTGDVLLSGLGGSVLGALVGAFVVIVTGERREHRNQVKDLLVHARRNVTKYVTSVAAMNDIKAQVRNGVLCIENDKVALGDLETARNLINTGAMDIHDDAFALRLLLGSRATRLVKVLDDVTALMADVNGLPTDDRSESDFEMCSAAKEQVDAEINRVWSEVNATWMHD